MSINCNCYEETIYAFADVRSAVDSRKVNFSIYLEISKVVYLLMDEQFQCAPNVLYDMYLMFENLRNYTIEFFPNDENHKIWQFRHPSAENGVVDEM
jgi:hypothetical protein